ncbi:MAG: hypothetical protein RL618_1128 [Pseudomonadota bacterium]|jgi:hypothetical protein
MGDVVPAFAGMTLPAPTSLGKNVTPTQTGVQRLCLEAPSNTSLTTAIPICCTIRLALDTTAHRCTQTLSNILKPSRPLVQIH